MQNGKLRRVFLAAAVVSAGPAGASDKAAVRGDTLWDTLARNQASAEQFAVTQAATPLQAPRHPLGPVPGYTLPAPASETNDLDALFGSRKQRHSGLFGSIGDWFGRLEAATGTRIKATGHNNLSLRAENVTGNKDAYQNEQYYGRGTNGIYNDTNLSVDATFMKYFHYRTTIDNSLFHNPNDNQVKLDYNSPHLRVEWGDINAGFQGNSLIDFSRYLNGIRISNQWTRQLNTSVLYSQTKAETRTITLPGNNSSGPYYVYAGQIVEGSDQVRVDNRSLQRGADYTLDLLTGELRFTSGNIVLASQTIAVTFETLGYNQQKGSIYGMRADYHPISRVRLGVTYVAQTANGSTGLRTQTQQFFGHVDPGQPYTLDAPVDPARPIVVTVSGVPLVRNIDFVVDANLTNQILLKQSVPQNQIVQAVYVPLNVTPTPGNRSVMGLDGSLSFGKLGSLTVESAFSGLDIGGASTAGHAYQIRADLNPLKNLHTTVALRNVNPTFSSIQSPGFNRNEKAIEFTGDYSPTSRVKLNMGFEKAQRPSYYGSVGNGLFTPTVTGSDRYTQYNAGGSYNFARNASLNLTRTSIGTDYSQGGNSRNTNDSMDLNYSFKSITLDAGLSRYKNTGSQLIGGTASTVAQNYFSDSSTFSKRLGLTWRPFKWVDLAGTFSNNNITSLVAGAETKSTAKDSELSARFRVGKALRLSYRLQLSDTGSLGGTTATGTTLTGGTGTTTGNTGGTTGTTIVGPARGAAGLWLPTRDVVAGGATSIVGSTLGTGNNLYGTTFGGGSNANLGSFGNYSSYYGNGINNGYGYSSFGGRSTTNSFGVEYNPVTALLLSLTLDSSSSIGAYQYNSNRNGVTAAFNWQPGDRLALNTSYTIQKVAYTGGYGGTGTNSFQVWLQGRPFGGKLVTNLSWQSLRTASNVNFASLAQSGASGTGVGSIPTDLSSALNSVSARLDYPISNRHTLFMEMLNASSSGYLASTDSQLRFGMDYALTRTFKLSMGWQILSRQNKDAANAQYNYRVSSLLLNVGLNFN